MNYGLVFAAACCLGLAACAAADDSPLEQEQIVKLAPGETYQIMQGATQMVAATKIDEDLKIIPSSDGYQEIRISYVWQGREIVSQKFRMTPGASPAETRLHLTLSPAPSATGDDRRKFARIKKEQSQRFAQFGKMLNSDAMAQLLYASTGVARYQPPSSLSGKTPMGQAPLPSVEASAPEMSAAPTLDPTASVR